MECIFESDLAVSRSNTTFKVYQGTLSDFNNSLNRGSYTSGLVSHECFSTRCTFVNVVSPIIVLLYAQVEVDLEQPPVEQIWPEVMGIILGSECMDGAFSEDI